MKINLLADNLREWINNTEILITIWMFLSQCELGVYELCFAENNIRVKAMPNSQRFITLALNFSIPIELVLLIA